MVDRRILLDKLWNAGVGGVPHRWFKSYLMERKHWVRIVDKYSDLGTIHHGVNE